MKLNIEHNPTEQSFGVRLDDEYAYLEYSRVEGALSLDRVFVPPSFRGQGIAAELTESAFRYCQNNDLKVVPVCPYIKDQFLPEHPEWKSLVREDGGPGKGAEFLRIDS